MDRLFLIDASGFIYRAYFAIQAMSSSRGEATGALFGFIRSLHKLDDVYKNPPHIVAVFDGPRSKEARLAIYPQYKAHRKKTPDDLIAQMIDAQKFCEMAGIPTLTLEGIEADDTIASVVKAMKHKFQHLFICSADKDFAQLVEDPAIRLLNQQKELEVDEAKVFELFHVKPTQIVDYLALCGDTSDNVPGVAGFGPKTVQGLLANYGSIDGMYQHLDAIGGKKKELLLQEKENVALYKRLIQLDCDAPVPKEKSFFHRKAPDDTALQHFFKEKEFFSLLKKMEQVQDTSRTYHIVHTEKELDDLCHELQKHHQLAIDTETTSEDPMQAEIVGIGFAYSPDVAYYVPCNGEIPKETVLAKLRPLFTGDRQFFGHNIKYDWHILLHAGIHVQHICFDTMIASYVLNAHVRRHSLDELTFQYFGKKKIDIKELIGTGRKAITMDQVPVDRVGEYCTEDVTYTYRLRDVLAKELRERNLESVFTEIELPLIPILAKMEQTGMYVDVSILHKLSSTVRKQIAAVEQEIFALAGEEFTINSPKQLAHILFDKLQLPAGKRGKEAPSTSIDVLEGLEKKYPIAAKIIEYRTLEKLRSTYIDALPEQVNPKTGRIHTQFNQSVAATGRLASQNPNLQNIPIRTELGKDIREAFRPENPGYVYVSADYSQIELRLLAHMSGDEGLLHAFHHNIDVHAATAAKLFNVTVKDVSEEMRRKAKVVNFGILYGQGPFGLSQELGISTKEAAAFIEDYFAKYPKIKEFIETCKEQARKTEMARTLTGRERRIPEITSTNQVLRTVAERLAVNTPLQGTAADIIKLAMIAVDKFLTKRKMKSKLILQIHDELIFEAPEDECDLVKECVHTCMEHVLDLKVQLSAQISIGKNWKEC